MSPLDHDVKARDPERKEIERQLAEWLAAGNIPQVIPTKGEKS